MSKPALIMDLESKGIIKVYWKLYMENEWPGDKLDAVLELIRLKEEASKGSNIKKETCLSEITNWKVWNKILSCVNKQCAIF